MSEFLNLQCVTSWGELAPEAVVIVPCWGSHLADCCTRVAGQIGGDAGQLTRIMESAPDKALLVCGPKGKRAVKLLGVGPELTPAALRTRVVRCLRSSKRRPEQLGLDLSYAFQAASGDAMRLVDAAVEGCVLGDYDPGALHKTDHPRAGRPAERGQIRSLSLLVSQPLGGETVRRAETALAVASAQRGVLDLVNQPGNVMTPSRLAEAAREAGERDGFQVRVLDKAAIEQEGLKALLAVNQGSSAPPALIVLEHRPVEPEASTHTIGLVGKGITFDTGGISLKARTHMLWMKSDMAGAAAVIGTLSAAARARLPVHLIGVIPATDNKPDGAALTPGDVIGSRAGISIEVEDTDAEGRLVLADGLAYLNHHFAPDVMIDLATLTGACLVALGDQAAGLFSQNDELAQALTEAGERTGERLWRLPLWPEYDRQIESDVADVKNLGGRGGGAITAARFLSKFTTHHPAWAHLDIAAVAFPETEGSRFRTPSGFGVRLLADYLSNLAEQD